MTLYHLPRLLDCANQNGDSTNLWNMRLRGERKNIIENRNMWGSFTVEDSTPFLEFDFIGSDVHLLVGKSQEEVSHTQQAPPLTGCCSQ